MSETVKEALSGFAATDLVRHTFGRYNAVTRKIEVCPAGASAEGVIHDAAAAGRAVALNRDGYPFLVRGGAAVAVGANVMVGAGGKGVTATAGNVIVGKALTLGALDVDFEIDFYHLSQAVAV